MSLKATFLAKFLRPFLSPAVVMGISGFFLIATLSLSMSAQNIQDQGAWFTSLLIVNAVGILVMLVFLLASLFRLIRQYKKRVMGSRLMVRFVVLFVILTIIPISVVYYFSAQFLSKGVDSWFDDKIEQALSDAHSVGQSFLEASKQSLADNARADARQVLQAENTPDIIRLLEQIRSARAYTEIDLYNRNGQIIASSNIDAVSLFPDAPDKADMNTARKGGVVIKLEPIAQGALQYRILYPVIDSETIQGLNQKIQILQIIQPLPLRYSRLGNSLEQAQSEYNRLSYLRRPLKLSFLLTLSLITLMTTLISIWLALYASRRLVAPINDLAIGTRAVAAGDYSTQLAVKSDDELGTLVGSFNSMITQVRRAKDDAEANHLKEQNQRAYLQSVLSNLSSGVLSFDAAHILQTHNASASAILGVKLNEFTGTGLAEICVQQSALIPLCEHLNEVMLDGMTGEQEVVLDSEIGKQILMVRTSILTEQDTVAHGWVVVFDDVTKLVDAQRDAAWGEVARRLAHEIKNPLTPIQLSAERIRRKYLHTLPESERDALDRSTRTISEQVQTLKRMVDAFSNYARSERLNLSSVNVNRLIEDVVELHRNVENSTRFELNLSPNLDEIRLDQDAIRQVMNNLVANASEALSAQAQGKIRLSTALETWHDRSGVMIKVQDNGVGFNEDMIDKIFEPYVTSKAEGTGLGMAIVKRIAQAHGGFVVASNYTLGEKNEDESGAQVKVWLPINDADKSA
ncbi:MAG: ATP-binding protein [Arenicellales bacterium]